MPVLHDDTLRVAEILLETEQPGSAARRRAASTAYYSAFQSLSALCALCLSRAKPSSEAYLRAYRALEHRQVRDLLSRSTDFKAFLSAPFAQLQNIRQWADYNVSTHPDETDAQAGRRFTIDEARASVGMARKAIEFVDSPRSACSTAPGGAAARSRPALIPL